MVEIVINSTKLHGEWFGTASSSDTPIIVLLHEGLGSVSVWRDFPNLLANYTNTRVFAYSRAGHGRSSSAFDAGAPDSLHREALHVLPKVLGEIGFNNGFLLGHSDGASIATIYAGNIHHQGVKGLVLIEPHFNIEVKNLSSIRELTARWVSSGLRDRLARHHADVDSMFAGWSSMWLNPNFKTFDITPELGSIRIPILFVKSEEDPYSTMLQIDLAKAKCASQLESVIIPGIGHSPHRTNPEKTLTAIGNFTRKILNS